MPTAVYQELAANKHLLDADRALHDARTPARYVAEGFALASGDRVGIEEDQVCRLTGHKPSKCAHYALMKVQRR